ncbi:MAG TPA: glutamyl-tRNA reductase [Terriglobales bacterium]|nr:glutamyl-tRNA reductase [Terriglobales bacterium]
MNVQLIGVNHRSAPVEIRERFAVSESRLPDALQHLLHYPGVEEGIILSTCNRVEVLAGLQNGAADLRGFVADYFKLPHAEFEPYLYEFREKEAIKHLFRVTSSLDSMVVGEPQILGQVKEAYAIARAVGAVHSQLDALLTRSFAVAKKVRNETAIASSAVSVASVAVELAKKIFGDLKGKSVYLVGAGKMCELAARHLLASGIATIYVVNRTHERALEMARRFDGQALQFSDLYDTCDKADIVITSTGAPHAIFRREHGEAFMARRRNRPMFFIDIAVPRDVDPTLNDVDGIFVYDIDDLQQVVSSHISDRKREALKAEDIVALEVERFSERLRTLDVVPTILSLQEYLDDIRQAEIERFRSRLGTLTPEQEVAIDALTRGMVNKIMHTPITNLKSAARQPEATTVVEVMRRLFNLSDKSRKNSKSDSAGSDGAVS